jgi:acetyl/propionyl-CoA carboxylase alpha subunit
MYDAAIKITTHIGYVGAGTVEFILDGTGEFYFLEMNTRLQVEHPVTEMITGLDLVELQIKVAQGERFPLAQREITRTGHALEVRLYAEDPERNFMPTPGCLTFFSTPHLPHVRCENGYQTGNMVSSTYDPMIAKVAAWGKTRPAAVNRLFNAIAQTRITGTINNRNFLMRILDQPDFLAGKTSTAFINEHQDELFAPSLTDIQIAGLAAGYMLFSGAPTPESTPTPREHSAWNHPKLVGMR